MNVSGINGGSAGANHRAAAGHHYPRRGQKAWTWPVVTAYCALPRCNYRAKKPCMWRMLSNGQPQLFQPNHLLASTFMSAPLSPWHKSLNSPLSARRAAAMALAGVLKWPVAESMPAATGSTRRQRRPWLSARSWYWAFRFITPECAGKNSAKTRPLR